jgi:alpha-L-rhamnosidase
MVEFIREPDGVAIANLLPKYSWIVPEQAGTQKAYQILVSSSAANSQQQIGDIWDSKQVPGDPSINIQHGGKPLQPDTTYYWKVRIWDRINRVSDYSSMQVFKTRTNRETVSTKNRFQIEFIEPIVFQESGPGRYFIDFGKDAFGTLLLTYKTREPDTVIIRLGEKLKEGKIDQAPGGCIRFLEVALEVTPEQSHYELQFPPDKRNTNHLAVLLPESLGVVIPFRYCEIENAKEIILARDVRQKALFHYFRDNQSHFHSSDSMLNQIWELCKYSIKATSFSGIYIDGDRERIAYEGDAYINQLSHYAVDREYAMARQTIEYLMKKPTWPTEWQLHIAMMFYQDYYYTGDTSLIEAFYDNLKYKSLLDLARNDGLISSASDKVTDQYLQKLGFPSGSRRIHDVVDWPPGERDGYEMRPINTVVNSFFYYNMVIMSEFASLLNKPNDADVFYKMAANVRDAINSKLFDSTRGVYVDGEGSAHASLHANMIPLALDLVPPQQIPSVVNFIKSRGMACSVFGAQYLLEGLFKNGEVLYALELMRAKHDRSWWNMIKVGSTITMEAWDMKYKPNSDWNHPWATAPANIIPRYLWGIQPLKPGYEQTRIHPQMGDLKHSSILVPTMRGQIKGEYRQKKNHRVEYTIELPANMSAEFSVPDTNHARVTVNGHTVDHSLGHIQLISGKNHIQIEQRTK